MNFIKKTIFVAAVIHIFSITAAGCALAQMTKYKKTGITPSHVFQMTEIFKFKLNALGFLNMDDYNALPIDNALRHPRHVMQKVRECHGVMSRLLQKEGKKADHLPDVFSLREIRPSDVYAAVDHLITETQKLGQTPDASAPLVKDKLPNDVYNNLNRICHAVPSEIQPSDVHQIAATVLENMRIIARYRDYEPDKIQEVEHVIKIPKHVFQETWAFLKSLRLLALDHDYAIPGGVIMPTLDPEREILPYDSMALMNDALAETEAVKYALGVREKTKLSKRESGKTPTDAFNEIYEAHLVVKMLIKHEKPLQQEMR